MSLQHEYGIFGGDDGAYILDFLERAARARDRHAAHRARQSRRTSQRAIVQKMAKAARLVVMSQVAADLLARRYDAAAARRSTIIPHGIPDMAPRDQDALKAQLRRRRAAHAADLRPARAEQGHRDRDPRAARGWSRRFPTSSTSSSGPRTRPSCARTARPTAPRSSARPSELGVRDHVVFRDQFVTTDELCSYLQAADVFVSPYLNEAQVTSGALSYAMGAGAAVVSTPYWHAKELLADGRGRLFPFGDSAAPRRRRSPRCSTRRRSWRACASTATSSRARSPGRASASSTCSSAATLRRADARARRRRDEPRAPAACPSCASITCVRLTDDTGIIQHATFSVPARASGYCVDDNARALIVALHADRPERLARRPSGWSRRTSAFFTSRRPPTGGSATS